jgi:uncharacterized membrane protein YfcA
MNIAGYIVLGLVAGTLGGLVGIGGGIIIVPVLVYLFGLTQHQAQGTTLALMVPPIGLLAALEYYKGGYVDLRAAGLICIGFFVGGFIGGKLSVEFSEELLRKLFAAMLLLIALRMIIWK